MFNCCLFFRPILYFCQSHRAPKRIPAVYNQRQPTTRASCQETILIRQTANYSAISMTRYLKNKSSFIILPQVWEIFGQWTMFPFNNFCRTSLTRVIFLSLPLQTLTSSSINQAIFFQIIKLLPLYKVLFRHLGIAPNVLDLFHWTRF